jgi:hypothetical protein
MKGEFMKTYIRSILVVALLLGVAPVPSVRAADQVVINTNDSGAGSLRQAIADVGTGETITFNLTTPATITLTRGCIGASREIPRIKM